MSVTLPKHRDVDRARTDEVVRLCAALDFLIFFDLLRQTNNTRIKDMADGPCVESEAGNSAWADIVLHNLNRQQLWTKLSKVELSTRSGSIFLLSGTPFETLHPDDPDDTPKEWVLPCATEDTISVSRLSSIFEGIKKLGETVNRLVMAMVTNDSTVVYYIVNEGLVKPRRN